MKKLTTTFLIPKKKVKNANVPMNYIISSQKSAWIREYSEKIWADAVREQFKITAIEPAVKNLLQIEVNDDVAEVIQELEILNNELDETLKEREAHDDLYEKRKEWRAELRLAKKEKDEALVDDLEKKIHDYDEMLTILKASAKRLRATRAARRKHTSKTVNKELRKVSSAKRRNYIKQKLELNADKQLFKACAVVVHVSNISKHKFDAPNFYPTVKAILDAATDTGVIWPDDNNEIIRGGVLFLEGDNVSKTHYTFEITIISDWPWLNQY